MVIASLQFLVKVEIVRIISNNFSITISDSFANGFFDAMDYILSMFGWFDISCHIFTSRPNPEFVHVG